ncbi:hypothetical protein EMMF5_005291 [Cystobasidiomycetes sp. EMM_F5]
MFGSDYSSASDSESAGPETQRQTTKQQHAGHSLQAPHKQPSVLPLDSFYKTVTTDLLFCRNESFFSFLFSQIFSRKVKAYVDGKCLGYDDLRSHFIALRRRYFAHAADGVLRWGPTVAQPSNGGREGYLAAHFVCASLASSSSDDRANGLLQYNTLLITDTLEIQWVEGKEGEMRRISRFDRTTRRPVQTP